MITIIMTLFPCQCIQLYGKLIGDTNLLLKPNPSIYKEELWYRGWKFQEDLLISNEFQDCTIPGLSTNLATLQGNITHLQFRFPKARHQTTICAKKARKSGWRLHNIQYTRTKVLAILAIFFRISSHDNLNQDQHSSKSDQRGIDLHVISSGNNLICHKNNVRIERNVNTVSNVSIVSNATFLNNLSIQIKL